MWRDRGTRWGEGVCVCVYPRLYIYECMFGGGGGRLASSTGSNRSPWVKKKRSKLVLEHKLKTKRLLTNINDNRYGLNENKTLTYVSRCFKNHNKCLFFPSLRFFLMKTIQQKPKAPFGSDQIWPPDKSDTWRARILTTLEFSMSLTSSTIRLTLSQQRASLRPITKATSETGMKTNLH